MGKGLPLPDHSVTPAQSLTTIIEKINEPEPPKAETVSPDAPPKEKGSEEPGPSSKTGGQKGQRGDIELQDLVEKWLKGDPIGKQRGRSKPRKGSQERPVETPVPSNRFPPELQESFDALDEMLRHAEAR